MASSIPEAIAEAIADIEAKTWVIDAEHDTSASTDLPNNLRAESFTVYHKLSDDRDYTQSRKMIYIDKSDFSWNWHQGGSRVEAVETPTKDFFESKISEVITAMSLDHLEIIDVNETAESANLLAIKTDTGDNAFTYTVKAWKTGTDTYDYKIIDKTSVT